MLMRAGVLSWIKPGERFRSSLGSVVTNSKWKRNLKYPSRISQSTSLFMQCCAMCKIEFHDLDLEFRKMKRNNDIELLKFSIEKVLKSMENDF